MLLYVNVVVSKCTWSFILRIHGTASLFIVSPSTRENQYSTLAQTKQLKSLHALQQQEKNSTGKLQWGGGGWPDTIINNERGEVICNWLRRQHLHYGITPILPQATEGEKEVDKETEGRNERQKEGTSWGQERGKVRGIRGRKNQIEQRRVRREDKRM